MRYFFLLFTLFIGSSINCQPLKSYKIEIKLINGVKEGKAFLRYWGKEGPHLDSADFTNGIGFFMGTVPEQLTIAKVYLKAKDQSEQKPENSCEVFIEGALIRINADKELQNARYSGTGLQVQFSELYHDLLPLKKKQVELDNAYIKSEKDNDNVTKDKLLNESYPALFKEKQKILGSFIKKNPSSLLSAKKFEEFIGDSHIDIEIVEPVFKILDDKLKQLAIVKLSAERIAISKRTAPGMKFIEFVQTDTSGNKISLSSFNGKYVLIDFWAGWCIPCRAENPRLLKLYSQYKEKGFEILGVSLDGERKAWTGAIIKDKLIWSHVSDLKIFENEIAKLYGIVSIPQNLLIGPDGKIIAWNLRGSVLENKLKTMLD